MATLADPPPALETYQRVLERLGTVIDLDIDPLDRTGVPVTSCSLLVDGELTHHGNGYGADRATARRNGLGEMVERAVGSVGVARLRREAVVGSHREVVDRRGDEVVDPRSLALPAGCDWSADRPLEWLRLTRVRDGAPVLVPLDLVASEPGEVSDRTGLPPLLPPVSNGLGAGLDADRAVAHGLGEVLQRHTNGLRFRALDRLSPVIALDGLPAEVLALVDRLRAGGIEPVLKHAATELGVCSTYAVAHEVAPLGPVSKVVVTACGEAADPDPTASMVKSLLELANSRARKAFCFGDLDRARALMPPAYRDHLPTTGGDERAARAMRGWAELSADELAALCAPDTTHVTTYDALAPDGPAPADGSPRAVLDHLLAAFAPEEVPHEVLAAVTELDGAVVAKVLVTGLDVETLSHGRIGELGARFSIEHDLDLVRRADGPVGEHTARVHLPPDAEERLGGPAWFSYAVAERIVGPLYPLYREPLRHTVEV